MKKYLVTGGEGFIGSHIAAKTGGVSFDVKSGQDILDTDTLSHACQGASGVFHCAAKISVPESVADPEWYYRTNVLGTRSVIAVCQHQGAKMIFCSSSAVYGISNGVISESDSTAPQSPYGQNKLDSEQDIRAAGIPSVILRYFNVYGPGQSAAYAGVISIFIRRALANEPVVIYGDGTQTRDFVFVDDVVRANIAAMDTDLDPGEIINIGSGCRITINELAEKIISLSGSSSQVVHAGHRTGDIEHSCANIAKAKRLLGWEPVVTLDEGLQKVVAWYRAEQNNASYEK